MNKSTVKEKNGREEKEPKTTPLRTHLQENMNHIKGKLGHSSDLIVREVLLGRQEATQAVLFYLDGMADSKMIQTVLESLLIRLHGVEKEKELPKGQALYDLIKNEIMTMGEVKDVSDMASLFSQLLSGSTLILFEGNATAMSVGTGGWEDRGVQEPTTESVIRGPREGFSETLRTNTTLIRRKIKDPNLWLETFVIGTVTQTHIAMMYIHDIANKKLIEEVRRRLSRIDIDSILESGYIEDLIQDEMYTPFPTIYHSERPDVIAAGLLEGRVAILVDGTPFVLLVPALFAQFYQASEDYYQRVDIAFFTRFLRVVALVISMLGPALYIAITTFHQEMIPSQLLASLAAQREGVPFPAFVEAVMMEFTFEILREAGVRMPKAVGSAISIVGALVIGQAAVEAGIVSAAMVIVVSITAVSTFALPSFNMGISIRLLRFLFMIFGATFGLYGIMLAFIAMLLHLSSLRSFGVPYLAPLAPFLPRDQKDMLIRAPRSKLTTRPRLLSRKNPVREETPATTKKTSRNPPGTGSHEVESGNMAPKDANRQNRQQTSAPQYRSSKNGLIQNKGIEQMGGRKAGTNAFKPVRKSLWSQNPWKKDKKSSIGRGTKNTQNIYVSPGSGQIDHGMEGKGIDETREGKEESGKRADLAGKETRSSRTSREGADMVKGKEGKENETDKAGKGAQGTEQGSMEKSGNESDEAGNKDRRGPL